MTGDKAEKPAILIEQLQHVAVIARVYNIFPSGKTMNALMFPKQSFLGTSSKFPTEIRKILAPIQFRLKTSEQFLTDEKNLLYFSRHDCKIWDADLLGFFPQDIDGRYFRINFSCFLAIHFGCPFLSGKTCDML